MNSVIKRLCWVCYYVTIMFLFSEETSEVDECHLQKTGECDEHMHCDIVGSVTRCTCDKGYVRQQKELRKCVRGQ